MTLAPLRDLLSALQSDKTSLFAFVYRGLYDTVAVLQRFSGLQEGYMS